MARIVFLTLAWLVFAASGFSAAAGAALPPVLYETYRDIPGVTPEEIAAIEALKSDRNAFSYGVNISTESYVLPDGTYAGFATKLCRMLSNLFGISFVLKIYEWDEMLEKFDAGALDFVGELTPTPERVLMYNMSLPIATRMLRIFTHVDSSTIQIEKDIHKRKIGFLAGSITAQSIKSAYPVAFVRVDVNNHQMAAMMLEKGEIDAFVDEAVVDPRFEQYDFIRSRTFFPAVYEAVSIAAAKPELAPIISVVNKYITAGGVDALYRLYKEGDFEYIRHKLDKLFTDEERAYLKDITQRGEPVGVAYAHDNYPISFYNKNAGEFQGIAADVLKAISRLTGIHFEASAKDAARQAVFDKLKSGEIRMAAQFTRSASRRGHFLWSADPYSRSYYAIMSKSEYPNLDTYQMLRESVGVLKKSGAEEVYRQLFPNHANLKQYDTIEGCLDALERGEVDLLMASEHILFNQAYYREKSGFKINMKLNVPMDSYFGFAVSEGILASIISKAQQFVQTDMIETSWTGRVFDYEKKLAQERTHILAFVVAELVLVLALTIFLLARNVRLSRKLAAMANTDSLTGICNRRHFWELCRIQVERSQRIGKDCFVILLDLDRFKVVNDQYGHQAGDKVLQEVAKRVQKAIRSYDLLGRYGGEEFILLVLDMDKAGVLAMAERIRQDVCSPAVAYEGKKIPISASFGVAVVNSANTIELAVKCADEALYRAKNEGRNRVVFYENDARPAA